MRLLLAVLATILVGTSWAAGGPPAAQGASLKGEVLEVRDVDAYTYLRLKTAEGETWAAVNKAPVKKGAVVTIENTSVMTNFESKTLKKTFDRIVFGSLAGSGSGSGAVAAPKGADMGQVHQNVAQAPATATADIKVPKATGPDARTVAEIAAKRADLKDKPVLVRGKVVKFTPGVMGKNWIHLRDGTGTAADGTNDLVVTTKEETQVGDVVLARGIVRTDVDLGSGYAYKVLVEEATLRK